MRSTIPRIAHLPGSHVHEDDLLLGPEEARPFFTERAVVSEKMDGISIMVRLNASEEVDIGLKADWLRALGGRVRRAAVLWARLHEDLLRPVLRDGSRLYGEWLWHRLSISYDSLPAAAVFFAIQDRRGRVAPRLESHERLVAHGLPAVSPLFVGVLGETPIASLCRRSGLGRERAEGLIVEISGREGVRWAKWVRPGYRQPSPNELDGSKNRVRAPSARRVSP